MDLDKKRDNVWACRYDYLFSAFDNSIVFICGHSSLYWWHTINTLNHKVVRVRLYMLSID